MAHVLILSIIFGVCCTLAEKSDNTTTNENSKNLSNSEDKFLANAIRGKNLSELALDNIDDEGTKKTDKKPRTVLHRDSSLERDKSIYFRFDRIPAAAVLSTVPADLHDRIIITTGFLQRPDGIPPITSVNPLIDTDGKRKVGLQVPSETAIDPVEEAEAESTQEVSWETASETANRPITLGYGSGNGGGYGYVVNGYGGYGRPTGHGGSISTYGISGTLADGDEFGPNDASYPDASTPQGNIQAQKAIALKALAGVALIGAAAALASNPVLLPIGFVSGRRKRSETFTEDEQANFQMDYILYMLRENLAKIQKDSNSKLVISPRCVARLTCEIQKDYLSDIGKDVEILNTNRRYYLTNLYASFLNI
ncbi:hypothetical protein ALC56_15020 [Trachymyrmex septentrionalis]|uniref:Uncharacterized protein n=1 Tax=Trachymyrmex septentrionalis TaxID=34720 RepID=A0A151JSW8_9HYME|nr:hypothetical protein ALC56_15020 [Trachymyrmex septentrionalis]